MLTNSTLHVQSTRFQTLCCYHKEKMSKILKAILIGAYGALLIQLMRTLRMERYETLIELNYLIRSPGEARKLEREIKKTERNIHNYKKPERLPTDFRFILKYTKMLDFGFKYTPFTKGQQPFIDGQCEYHNCYFTTDKTLVRDLRNFDAIIFDVENTWELHPIFRASHQKYVFTAMESSSYYPLCDPRYENYYNWTWSYRLDSDIVWTYISIYDNNNTLVGPKINMTWIDPMAPVPERIINILSKKKKMAAWFVSFCNAKSSRMNVTKEINRHLKKYGYEVDIFGRCGSMICPKSRMEECLELLQEDYHFYFAFENSMSADYVTEKLLYAVMHYTMPVVYGGADYSRFLPPGSYIDASAQDPSVTASIMIDLIKNKDKKDYYDCFRWHNHYMYKESADVADVCVLCKLLNQQQGPTVVKNLRKWWHPDFRSECGDSFVEQPVKDLVKKTAGLKKTSPGL